MTAQILQALGGLGMFLLGMIVLTDGLRSLAGDAVHRVLVRFTKTTVSGALTGAGVTAVLQSSSVTTVATVGFVSAGLIAFPQALGVLFGANLGTTATGWMVALLGFQLDIEPLVMPTLFLGVVLKLFGRSSVAHAGWALTGFAVLFLGIAAMQAGMAGFEGMVTPDDFPRDTWLGRLALVGIGVLVTLVTQSSSAGIATALTALAANAITFEQAAAMAIGMDVGTTSTTAIATIGGSAQTKRTGYAHVVYNLFTGVMAFALLGPYTRTADRFLDGGAAANASIALVGFHTFFNGLGVIAVLPFTSLFAKLMTRLVPERDPEVARRFDRTLLVDPTAASVTLLGAVRELAADSFEAVARALDPGEPPRVEPATITRVDRALEDCRDFASQIVISTDRKEPQRLLIASMHAIDHLERLVERARARERVEILRTDPSLGALAALARGALDATVHALRADEPVPEVRLRETRDGIRAERRDYRARVIAAVPEGTVTLDDALRRLDAIRWLHRMTYHAWRIGLHLDEASHPVSGPPAPPTSTDAPSAS